MERKLPLHYGNPGHIVRCTSTAANLFSPSPDLPPPPLSLSFSVCLFPRANERKALNAAGFCNFEPTWRSGIARACGYVSVNRRFYSSHRFWDDPRKDQIPLLAGSRRLPIRCGKIEGETRSTLERGN